MKGHLSVDKKGLLAARSNLEMKSLGTLPLRAHPS
ncbi:hypothetical protein T11_10761 [Trichinella zimbabwensis]|uniref:Uncharacterized protein n=1 Tax=Trichinella zimbabwensis TaxID=268475 RepID=A0A0V1G7E5_9BILA|nr:hypothetical protein T11_10761 [Trichinella zimbabwensis]